MNNRGYSSRNSDFFLHRHYNYRYYPASNMLWDQTKDLPKDRFKVVENIYAEAGCPIEVRLHLANFVESSFMTNEQVDERTAIGLAKQLIIELDAKIDALNDPDRVPDKRKLHELSDNLKVSSISSFLSENILVSKLN